MQRCLPLVSLLSMVLVGACSEGPRSVVAPEPIIQVSFDRNSSSTKPKATVSLGTDHSVSVAANGHQMTIKGNTGLIDGKYRVRFTKETADLIESGISEMENQQTVAARKLQQGAEQCAKRGKGHAIGSPTTHAPAAQAREHAPHQPGLRAVEPRRGKCAGGPGQGSRERASRLGSLDG